MPYDAKGPIWQVVHSAAANANHNYGLDKKKLIIDQIFANEAVATVVVDRMVNEAEIFYMEGESYRKHQREMKAQKKEKSESASKK